MSVIHDLVYTLKRDREYFKGWQANIAMAFVDEHTAYCRTTKRQGLSSDDLHEVANKAAQNFLNNLIS